MWIEDELPRLRMHSAGVRIGLRLWQIDIVYYYVDTDAFFARRTVLYQSPLLDVKSNLLAGATAAVEIHDGRSHVHRDLWMGHLCGISLRQILFIDGDLCIYK